MATRFCPECGVSMKKTRHGGYSCNGGSECPVYSARFDNKGRLLDVQYVVL